MFRILIDMCVWLDLARDRRQPPVLGVIEEMVKRGTVTLIVPRVVLDEFHRMDAAYAPHKLRTLSFKGRVRAKEAVRQL